MRYAILIASSLLLFMSCPNQGSMTEGKSATWNYCLPCHYIAEDGSPGSISIREMSMRYDKASFHRYLGEQFGVKRSKRQINEHTSIKLTEDEIDAIINYVIRNEAK